MRCHYYDAGVCRSCSLMGTLYASQLAGKQRTCEEVLGPVAKPPVWREPFASQESGFRNKAKLVVAGQPGAVTLGILDGRNRGVDLRECGLYEPVVAAALEPLAAFINTLRLMPYDVPARRGELKYLLVTASPAGELMVRFVLRSRSHLDALRRALPALQQALPGLRVASVNLQPVHKAILEGEEEIALTEEQLLPMQVNDVTLQLRPNSFFQTNTAVAAALYRQAAEWVSAAPPQSLWDLYCGVGGFALHAALAGARQVTGIEVSPEAVASAQVSAAASGIPARFEVGDAASTPTLDVPDMVIVNPPRRGIGTELAEWLEASTVKALIYSSCNPVTLARDLASMPSWQVEETRLFDMFPQTDHQEVMVRLTRR